MNDKELGDWYDDHDIYWTGDTSVRVNDRVYRLADDTWVEIAPTQTDDINYTSPLC